MAESPIERRKRLAAEEARKKRLKQKKSWDAKRAAGEAETGSKYGSRVGQRTPRSGFGYGAMGNAPKAKGKGDRSAVSGTVAAAKTSNVTPTEKPKPTTNNKPTKPSGRSTATTTGGGVKKPAVSQSRTMWVKKGDVVGGVTVKKGYLAQYGKPEKKVSAKVQMVTGSKKGKAVEYSKGRKTKGK